MLELLVEGTGGEVYADSAYQSAEAEAMLAANQVTSQVHERMYRNWSLSEEQKERNRQKSKVRRALNCCCYEPSKGEIKNHWKQENETESTSQNQEPNHQRGRHARNQKNPITSLKLVP